jgi:hypothetical protein
MQTDEQIDEFLDTIRKGVADVRAILTKDSLSPNERIAEVARCLMRQRSVIDELAVLEATLHIKISVDGAHSSDAIQKKADEVNVELRNAWNLFYSLLEEKGRK